MRRRISGLLWLTLAVFGASMVVVAGAVGLAPLSAVPNDAGVVVACGSAVRPLLPTPGWDDFMVVRDDCAQKQDAHRQVAVPLGVLGGVALAGGVKAVRSRRSALR
jgi:hypothetical protein